MRGLSGSDEGVRTFDDDDELIQRINVTPLVDVVLVLLVVLMVAATAALAQIPVQVPSSGEPTGSVEPLRLHVLANGTLHLDEETITLEELSDRVRSSGATSAVIRADEEVVHARVVQLMDELRKQHVRKLAIEIHE